MAFSIKALAMGLIIGLVIGLVAGYIVTPVVTPKSIDVTALERQISDLEKQIRSLREELQTKSGEKDAEITDLKTQIANLKTQITDLETQIEEFERFFKGLKVITWNDGSRETLYVDENGRIYLNWREVWALGFIIGETKSEVTEAAANEILDRLQADGIRFMAVSFNYWHSYDWCRSQVEYWFPKLYERKMWVMLQIHRTNQYDLFDVDGQFEWHNNIIDCVSANDLWAEMTFAITTFWEYDYLAYIWDKTNEEVETFCSQMRPLLDAQLASSKIGSVPVIGKCVNSTPNWHGSTSIVRYSDFPGWDHYVRVKNDGSVDHSIEDKAFEDWHLKQIPAAGKEGKQTWFTEGGSRPAGEGDHTCNPDALKTLISCNGWDDSSLAMLWELTSERPEWAYFNDDGTPNQHYLNITSSFPKVS